MKEKLTAKEREVLEAALHYAMQSHISEKRDMRGDEKSTIEEDYDIDGWDLIRLAVKFGLTYDPSDYGIGPIPPQP